MKSSSTLWNCGVEVQSVTLTLHQSPVWFDEQPKSLSWKLRRNTSVQSTSGRNRWKSELVQAWGNSIATNELFHWMLQVSVSSMLTLILYFLSWSMVCLWLQRWLILVCELHLHAHLAKKSYDNNTRLSDIHGWFYIFIKDNCYSYCQQALGKQATMYTGKYKVEI